MTADGWVWSSFGLLLALLGARAWVVETGHADAGPHPGEGEGAHRRLRRWRWRSWWGSVAANGGARLVYLVLTPGGGGRRSKTPRTRPTPRRAAGDARPGRPRAADGPGAPPRARRRLRSIGAAVGAGVGLPACRPRGLTRTCQRAFRPTATYLVSRYSSMPTAPPSRPSPDCLIPPNGAAGFATSRC